MAGMASMSVEDDVAVAGRAVREHRERAGLSRADLAAASAVSHQTIFRLETGKIMPQFANLCRLARALGLTVAQLITPPAP